MNLFSIIFLKKFFSLSAYVARIRYLYASLANLKKINIEIDQLTFNLNLSNYPSKILYAYKENYQKNTTAIIKHFVKPSMKCIDIGANIGYFSAILNKLVGKSGKVYSFECDDEIIEELKVNLQNFSSAIVKKGFVLNKDSHKFLHKKDKSKLIVINEFVQEENVDFIKIDIDGLDLIALQGSDKFLRKGKPIVLIEVSEDTLSRYGICFLDIINYMKKLNYAPYYVKLPLKKLIYDDNTSFKKTFSWNKVDDILFIKN
jgi:hypothetical protein